MSEAIAHPIVPPWIDSLPLGRVAGSTAVDPYRCLGSIRYVPGSTPLTPTGVWDLSVMCQGQRPLTPTGLDQDGCNDGCPADRNNSNHWVNA